MLNKTILKKQLDSFPENFTIDQLIDRLILIEKIGTGVLQSENNEVISESQLDQEIEKWFN